MGVSGLWTLLAPGGENVPLEALCGQRVAVDVSVWLVSLATAAAGSPAGEGARAACLAGLVARCCKLAFLRVRPVFVFDGPAPLLKRRTLRARRAARLAAARDAERARTRLWRLAEHKARLARAGTLGNGDGDEAVLEGSPEDSDAQDIQRLRAELYNLFAAAAAGESPSSPAPAAAFPASTTDEVYRLHVQREEVSRAQAVTTRRLVAAYDADPSNPARAAGDFSRAQVRAMQQKGALTHQLTEGRTAAARTAGAQMPTFRTVASDPQTRVLFCPGVVEAPRAVRPNDDEREDEGNKAEPLEIEVDLGAPVDNEVQALMREMMASMEKGHEPVVSIPPLPDVAVNSPSSSSSSSSEDDEDESEDNNEGDSTSVTSFLVGHIQQPAPAPEQPIEQPIEVPKKDKEEDDVVVLDSPEEKVKEVTTLNVSENEEKEENEEEDDDDDLVLPFKTSATAMEAAFHQDEEDAFAAAMAAKPQVTDTQNEEDATEEHEAKRAAPLFPVPQEGDEGDDLTAFGGVVDECRALLRLFGVPCVVAPSEADCECAALEQAGLVDAVLSDDVDVLLFGAQHVYRHAFAPGHHLEHYAMPAVTHATSLDRDDLVALALLLGSDYTLGVRGVGPVRAVEVLRAFGRGPAALRAFRAWCTDPTGAADPSTADNGEIARVLRSLRSAAPRLVFPSLDWPSAAVVDGYRCPLVHVPAAPLAWEAPDIAALTRFCLVRLGWDAERAERTLQPVAQHWARPPDPPAPLTGIQRFLVPAPAPSSAPQFTRFCSGTQVAEMQKMSPAVLALMKSRADAIAANKLP